MQKTATHSRLYAPSKRSGKTRALRWLSLGAACGLAGACFPDWDAYDPRVPGDTTSSSSGGGGTGGQSPVVCTPGAIEDCYAGPAGTSGVGDCKSGKHACNDTGTAFGPCQGEVTPTTETCLTAGDEDCDGLVNEDGPGCSCMPGETLPCYNGPMGTEGVGACTGGVLQCTMNGTFDTVCMGEVVPVLEECYTAIDDDCDGKDNEHCAAWAKLFGNSEAQEVTSVAVDGNGDVIITGYVIGSANFGGGALNSQGDKDVFIAKFDGDGNHLWSVSFGDPAEQEATALAVDGQNNIFVVGRFLGTLPFNPMSPLVSNGQEDIFLAKFDASGKLIWNKSFGDASNLQVPYGVAADTDGNVVITGTLAGTAGFDLMKPLTASGGSDIFLAKFSPDGTPIFSNVFGAGGNDYGWSVATGPGNTIALTGYFDVSASFGGPVHTENSGVEAFVAVFASDGTYMWSRASSAPSDQKGRAVDFDNSGYVYLFGDFLTSINWGLGDMQSAGSLDLFVAVFDPMGTPVSNDRYGDSSQQEAVAMSVDRVNNTINLVSSLEGSADFDGLHAQGGSGGNDDILAVKLNAADGSAAWVRRFGDSSDQDPRDVAVDPTGAIYVAGAINGKIDCGTGVLTSAGGRDGILYKLLP